MQHAMSYKFVFSGLRTDLGANVFPKPVCATSASCDMYYSCVHKAGKFTFAELLHGFTRRGTHCAVSLRNCPISAPFHFSRLNRKVKPIKSRNNAELYAEPRRKFS